MEMGRKLRTGLAVLSIAVLAGCGSGDGDSNSNSNNSSAATSFVSYTGKTSAAVIDSENVKSLASGADAVAAYAIEADDAYDLPPEVGVASTVGSRGTFDEELLVPLLKKLPSFGDQELQIKRQVQSGSSVIDCDSGTMTVVSSDKGASVTYSNCLFDGISYSGSLSSFNTATGVKIEFNDLTTVDLAAATYRISGYSQVDTYADGSTRIVNDITVTENNRTERFQGESYCDAEYNCRYSSYVSEGGKTYRYDIEQSVSSTSGSYSAVLKMYHPDYGYTTVTMTSLVPCEGGGFTSGEIRITDDSGSWAQLTYNSCGGSVTLTTSDGLSEAVVL